MRNSRFLLLLFSVCCFAACTSANNEEAQQEEKCTKLCDAGEILNEDTCECEKEPCTKTCETGFVLNNDTCECEKEACTKTCDSGFTLNADTCECEEDFVASVIEVEIESVALVGDWKKKTDINGYSGDAYFVWDGPNQFWKGPENIGKVGLLSFEVEITKPGTYLFQWRSYIAKKDPQKPNTEHNDSWLKILADDFYAVRETSTVYPKGSGKTPNPEGENGNGFFKAYMNTNDTWTWTTGTYDNNFHQIYARFDEAKIYTIEIAPRSSYHAIDKFKLIQQEP